jgi:uncharacterized membrane protein (GlpM family)
VESEKAVRNPPPGEEPRPQTFAAPMVGMVSSSLVVVAVIAVLDSQIGRDIEDVLAAPARTLIAAPAVLAAVVAFCASMLALLPDVRRPALQVAAIAGWVVAAWLVMAAMILAGIKFATDRIS